MTGSRQHLLSSIFWEGLRGRVPAAAGYSGGVNERFDRRGMLGMLDVSSYYDELHLWTHKDQQFQTFSGVERDAIHRFLIDGDSGEFSPDTIYKFIDPHMPPPGQTRGLDAGSGYGGTCFRNLRVHGGRWGGVTISGEQWRYARALASARGLSDELDFQLQSYDDELPSRYNTIVAIESLIHSPDPKHTMSNLAGSLDPGGRLVIVDDMPCAGLGGEDLRLLEAFRKCWRCPETSGEADWTRYAAAAGLVRVERRDLTHLMKPRAEADLDAALDDLTQQREAKSASGFARLSDAEIGGLHLERLHRRGQMRYVMLVFQR